MDRKMETLIKQARWKSNGVLGKKRDIDVVTTIYWQSEEAFIDTNSRFLFKMICANFFSKHDKKLQLSLEGDIGIFFPDAYRLYVYGLIYQELTGETILDNILELQDRKALFYRAMLDAQMPEHQRRVLRIIQVLDIDLKEESKKYQRILFNTKKKKEFKIENSIG